MNAFKMEIKHSPSISMSTSKTVRVCKCWGVGVLCVCLCLCIDARGCVGVRVPVSERSKRARGRLTTWVHMTEFSTLADEIW